ncbi:MAG: 50S ribosomal protein L28 [Brevinematales bacterium]|nr:50S ribosomal protein L28 [Brevinematales bacterium]
MARCEICGKGTSFGHNVSHSNKKTRRVWKPNVQKKRVLINGINKSINICTKCLKAGKIEEYVKKVLTKV